MINQANWQYFDFIKIFTIKNGFYNKKPDESGEGSIPFVGATDGNNGVTAYYTIEEIENASKTGEEPNQPLENKIFPANALCVTNNGSVGYAYFQDKPFTCSHDVNPLYLKKGEFNKYTAMFVATVIMHDRYRWGYGRKWRPKRMVYSKLKLPVIVDENNTPLKDDLCQFSDDGFIPDWKFMESYIKQMACQLPQTSNTRISANNIFNLKWKEFLFSDLGIEIYKAKSHAKVDMDFSKNREDSRLPFVSRTELNNSVDGWVIIDNNNGLENGNALVIGDTTSTISYQPIPFISGDHIVIIRAEWLNKYTGLFIETLLNKERYRYSYGRAFKMDLISNTKISLPIDNLGNPNWLAVEQYIKNMPYADNI